MVGNSRGCDIESSELKFAWKRSQKPKGQNKLGYSSILSINVTFFRNQMNFYDELFYIRRDILSQQTPKISNSAPIKP